MGFNRGSEWSKWDLHVHTPASIIQQYGGNTEEAWERYLTDLENLPPEFKVLGINDYLFLDGYKRLKNEKEQNGRLPNIELLLPVVEFRIEKFAGVEFRDLQRINLHVIFSDEVTVETIQSQFLNTLEQSYQIEKDNTPWHRAITRESIQELGQAIIASAPAEERHKYGTELQEGFNALNVKEDQMFSALKKDCFEDKYLIAIGKTEWDKLRWTDASISTKKDIINRANIIFTSAEDVTAFRNAKEKLSSQQVNDLLLDCSDAHRFADSENKDRIGKCFTWIKANTTFEGLRQILFEPERVRIQESNPSNKNSYQIIKEIRFIDSTNRLFFDGFQIGLNPDLNAIIGGKSSGKSLLLYHLAKSTMNQDKFNKLAAADGFQKYDDLSIIDMEIVWDDGQVSRLSDPDNNKRPVIYIPQMYLNYMAEEKSKNEDFKQTIEDILNGHEGYKEFYDVQKAKILYYEQQIDNEIKNYFADLYKLHDLQRELHQLGDKAAIETNIKSLIFQLEALRTASGFTEEEEKKYNELNASNQSLIDTKQNYIIQKTLMNELNQTTFQLLEKIASFVEEEFNNLLFKYHDSQEMKKIISNTTSEIIKRLQNANTIYLAEQPFKVSNIDELIQSLDIAINSNNVDLEPYNQKIRNLKEFQQKQVELNIENQKIITINAKIKEIEVQQNKIDINKILIPYSGLLECYKIIVAKNYEFRSISDNIELISEVHFNTQNFQRDFSEFITKNKSLQTLFENSGFNDNTFEFILSDHIANLSSIAQKIITGSVSFNKGKQAPEIIAALFKNYFDIFYDLKQGEDRLGHMSPGKKGIILFQLFLHLSSSKDPILIDQPEDNLDNRTVYKELNDFIKEKKLQRQIIIVSHNSNLVVSTDSENVIVAHQNGADSGRPKFEYINGALENTFKNPSETHILEQQGIREHVCEILEGGEEAFKKRERKYNI